MWHVSKRNGIKNEKQTAFDNLSNAVCLLYERNRNERGASIVGRVLVHLRNSTRYTRGNTCNSSL